MTHEHRSGDEHRSTGLRYFDEDDAGKAELFEEHGCRFSEFIRLPYFDGPRMALIDPMHCCYLGKCLFSYQIKLHGTDSPCTSALVRGLGADLNGSA